MFSKDCYRRLIQCATRGNPKEWNDWRRTHPNEKVLLEEAQFEDESFEYYDLSNAHLKKAIFINVDLRKANLSKANLEETSFTCSSLESAILSKANLKSAKFSQVNLTEAKFLLSNLESVKFPKAILTNAELIEADLRGGFLMGANCDGACLRHAILKKVQAYDASFVGTELKRANLEFASLQRANFQNANMDSASLIKAGLDSANLTEAKLDNADMRSTNLRHCKVNESTSIWKCFVDRKTDFEGVPLGSIKISPSTKQLIEYNLRRKSWKCWCREHKIIGKPVQWFWWISNYGYSTKRILITFLVTALMFAFLYWLLGILFPPGVISNLTVDAEGKTVPKDIILIRSIYFSIVTMTTLGFGDMYAEFESRTGYILLIFQVILGYVMLGAIVTRLNILFTGGGPAGEHFTDFKEGKCKSIYWPEEELSKIKQKRET